MYMSMSGGFPKKHGATPSLPKAQSQETAGVENQDYRRCWKSMMFPIIIIHEWSDLSINFLFLFVFSLLNYISRILINR